MNENLFVLPNFRKAFLRSNYHSSLQFNVASKKLGSKTLCSCLEEVAGDLRNLLSTLVEFPISKL